MRMMSVFVGLVLAAGEAQGDSQPTAEQIRFFESNVRPVLAEHCQKCHGPAKQWNGLRLDSREALLRGGDSGPAIVGPMSLSSRSPALPPVSAASFPACSLTASRSPGALAVV